MKVTKREKQVCKLLLKGMSNLRISKEMDIKEKTVKVYMTNILKKFKVKSRLQLAIELIKAI